MLREIRTSVVDSITRASASTFTPKQLSELGLKITLNIGGKHVRSVGPENLNIYPEIVVWRPDYEGAETGQVMLVECIETADTYEMSALKWEQISSLGIRLNIVVPTTVLTNVKKIVSERKIQNYEIQTWKINPIEGKIEFSIIQ